MSEHKYTIHNENQDPKASIIRKSNVDVDFTLYDLEKNKRDFSKLLKECEAQKQLADAKMVNIETHHPFVMDLSEEQCFTVHMYQESRAMSRVCGGKIPELKEELEYIEAELKEIEKQVGIAIPVASVDPGHTVTDGIAPVAPVEEVKPQEATTNPTPDEEKTS